MLTTRFTWSRIQIALASLIPLVSMESTHANQVSGHVVDADTMTPISGAIVTLQASSIKDTTAADGSFLIQIGGGTDLVFVAAAKGYFNTAITQTPPATDMTFLMPPVPQDDNPNYLFRSPQQCSACHPNQYAEWNGSPMSKAGLNTWVHDIFNGQGTSGGLGGFVYTRDSEFSEANPASECSACHQPENWIAQPFSRMEGPQDMSYPSTQTMHGISCETCHKVADINETNINYPGIFPGLVTLTRPVPGGQVMYGALGDVDFSAVPLMRASYQPQIRAALCGACHQDKNDPSENHSFDGITSEPTYIEWLESPYSNPQSQHHADCVTCHMPPTGETDICDFLAPPLMRDRATIRSHRIEGTTPFYLENAVELDMTTTLTGTTIDVDVVITNTGTGHHVPTGVTVRNMILLVEAWQDGNDPLVNPLTYLGNQMVHELGGVGNPGLGYYAGLPGKFYAKVNHNADGIGPTFFTDATGIQFDNRIPALASDATQYSFALPAGVDGNVNVRARLIYRRAFRFLVDAKNWTRDGHGNTLNDVEPPHYGFLMELAESSRAISTDCLGPGNGDVNGDGLLNGRDVEDFVTVLLTSPSGPPSVAFCAADMDGDGEITLDDAGSFITTLLAE